MRSLVPAAPVPLAPEQAEVMRQQQIRKHDVAVMLVHWFNALTWIAEILTGAALFSSRLFRVAPEWYVALLGGLFGSRANLMRFHVALGVTWIVVLIPYGLFGFRTYLRGEMLELGDRDDVRWLRIRLLHILGRSDEPLPPQGSYNAGQKAFALVVWVMVPLVALSGVVMAFQLFATWVVGWAVVLHFLAVGTVVAGLAVHVYMGAVFPEERPAFFSMITGKVNELFAYNHHFKWWREVKLAEQARAGAAAPESAAADAVGSGGESTGGPGGSSPG